MQTNSHINLVDNGDNLSLDSASETDLTFTRDSNINVMSTRAWTGTIHV